MNFISKLFSGVKQKAVTFFSQANTYGGEDYNDSVNLRTYKESLYLFIGVSMVRESVSGIPLELYDILNLQGDVKEVEDDPLLDVLERPNARQTQKEFWKLSVSYYILAGDAFWYLERKSEKVLPTQMANLRPDNVEILFSQTGEVVGYKFYKANGDSINLLPHEVLHFKNIDPTNPARGIGVLTPARHRILTELEAAKYQRDTFRNQGRPDVAVFVDSDLKEEDAEDARQKWQKVYNGKSRASAGFFGKVVKSVQLLNVSPKEMEGRESMTFLRDDILAALRIPKQMIDADVNYNNTHNARITYYNDAVLPVLDVFIDVLNNRFLVDLKQEKFLTYESPVKENRELLLKETTELKKAGIITVNEARELMNYEEIEGGDERERETGSSIQLSMRRKELRRVARRVLKKRKTLVLKFKAINALADLIRAEDAVLREKALTDPKRQRNSVFHTPELKEMYIRAFNNSIDKKAEDFKDHIDVYNRDLEARIMDHMEKFGINPQSIFNVTEELVASKKIFVPLMIRMFEKAGQNTMDSIAKGFSTKASEQFYTVNEMIQQLEQRAEFFTQSMLDTDYKELQEIIVQGMNEGKGVPEIGQMIRFYFDDMSVHRAKTIARTETGRLISNATNEAYAQSEFVTGKEWLTAQDTKVRAKKGTVNDHKINNGVIIEKGDTIFPNGERFPGELTINCRCAIAPTV